MRGRAKRFELQGREVDGKRNRGPEGSQTKTRVYVQEANWNVAAVYDSSDNTDSFELITYTPYGNPTFWKKVSGTWEEQSQLSSRKGADHLFQGRWLCAYESSGLQLQLYHFRHRAYSPTLGRFLQWDPLGNSRAVDDSSNDYVCFGANPVSNTDSTGLDRYITMPSLSFRSIHSAIAVDVWVYSKRRCCWRVLFQYTYSFSIDWVPLGVRAVIVKLLRLHPLLAGAVLAGTNYPGKVSRTLGIDVPNAVALQSGPLQDKVLKGYLDSTVNNPPSYNLYTFNCHHYV